MDIEAHFRAELQKLEKEIHDLNSKINELKEKSVSLEKLKKEREREYSILSSYFEPTVNREVQKSLAGMLKKHT
ncbi:MAG: hypothetical protein J4473_03750 [Candidatus Aenigmarchaeota archaeon]|nr:hypothetical protein [Candidatus Aenigmarchaeota archaeon]